MAEWDRKKLMPGEYWVCSRCELSIGWPECVDVVIEEDRVTEIVCAECWKKRKQ